MITSATTRARARYVSWRRRKCRLAADVRGPRLPNTGRVSRTAVQVPAQTAAAAAGVARRVAALAAVIAASLAVAAALHLSGAVSGRSAPYDARSAGIAEALIGVVLAATAAALARSAPRARRAGLLGFGFAIVGFGVGLSMTAQGGHWPDIAYHVAVLPLVIACFVALARAPRSSGGHGAT